MKTRLLITLLVYALALLLGIAGFLYFTQPMPAPFGESYTGQCIDIPTYR